MNKPWISSSRIITMTGAEPTDASVTRALAKAKGSMVRGRIRRGPKHAALYTLALTNATALELLALLYWNVAFSQGTRITRNSTDAEDIAQDTVTQFVSMVRAEPNPNLDSIGWIKTVAKNAALDRVRARKTSNQAPDSDESEQGNDEDDSWVPESSIDYNTPDALLEAEQTADAIGVAYEGLTADQQEVLYHVDQGLDYDEIGLIMGMTVEAVRQLVHRAREALKDSL